MAYIRRQMFRPRIRAMKPEVVGTKLVAAPKRKKRRKQQKKRRASKKYKRANKR